MATVSKRMAAIAEKVEPGKSYNITEALDLIKDLSSVKFQESIDISVGLGVDPRKSDQVVRGSTILPHGNGKTVRVAVFAEGAQAEAAQAAGADVVGLDDLAATVKNGVIEFDVAIATPDAMKVVGQLGQVLGPRGLMPNPKVGTVSPDVATAVKNAKSGQVRYRTDKSGIIHCPVGNVGFASDALKGNVEALLNDLKRAKPSSAKGIYLKKIAISSTMGPGLQIDIASLDVK